MLGLEGKLDVMCPADDPAEGKLTDGIAATINRRARYFREYVRFGQFEDCDGDKLERPVADGRMQCIKHLPCACVCFIGHLLLTRSWFK